MKARTKITLWTSSYSFVVAIIFSGFVFFELMEQPFRLIDRELRDIGDLTIKQLSANHSHSLDPQELSQQPYSRYWIKVIDDSKRTLLKTGMTEQVEIPSRINDRFYFERKDIALENIWIAEEDKDELGNLTGKAVTFRVLHEKQKVNNTIYDLLIAKPIPILALEMKELVVEILFGIAFCTILAVLASYYISGKIIRPLSKINSLIKEITDTSLNKRIPIEKNIDELHTLTFSLNAMFDRLQYSFDRQKEYIGNASHELKSPLTTLMLGHENVLSEPLPEDVRRAVEKQLNILRRLSKLVRNLLAISRLEQQESFNREMIDLKPVILHVIEEFEGIWKKQGIEINTDLDTASFSGDREKILQMLINLLDNAIKFNFPSNGKIWITVKKRIHSVDFSIANTGTTIPEESLKKIYEQFYRVEKSRSTMFGGAGLGLTIVKQIVTLHNGTIVATSDKTGITTFSISFPV